MRLLFYASQNFLLLLSSCLVKWSYFDSLSVSDNIVSFDGVASKTAGEWWTGKGLTECCRVILEILSLHLSGGMEENSEITLAERRCHVRDLNPTPLEHKFRVYHFTILLCRYVFTSPSILNILLVHVSLTVRYQASRPGVSLIRRCVLDSRRGSALKYGVFHSTTNERRIIQHQDLLVDTIT